jgi:hypothetical protein
LYLCLVLPHSTVYLQAMFLIPDKAHRPVISVYQASYLCISGQLSLYLIPVISLSQDSYLLVSGQSLANSTRSETFTLSVLQRKIITYRIFAFVLRP